MTELNRNDDLPHETVGTPTTSMSGGVEDWTDPRADDGMAPSEAFQTLASEVRVAVLVHLLRAEHRSDSPTSFSELQESVGSDSSAGFAYHLRQLDGHFVRNQADGYALTTAGRRAAEEVVSGTFTRADDCSAS